MEENETVELGAEQVPAAFKKRWDELIAQNKSLKTTVFEAQTEVKDIRLKLEASATAPNPELESAQARIKELEGTITKSEHNTVLAGDGISEEDAELYDYVQYQFGKVEVVEGQEKPKFSDWYTSAKESNKVIAAAINAKKQTVTPGKEAPKKVEPKLAPKTVPSKNPANGSEHAFKAEDISNMDPKTFAANKEVLRKQLFGS